MRLFLLGAFAFGIGVAQETKPSCGVANTAVLPNDAFRFTMDFLDSLEEARFAYRPSSDLPADADPTLQLSDLLFRVKSSSFKYDCAAELLRGYQKSKVMPISLAATYTVLIYQKQSEMAQESVLLLKRYADEKAASGDLAEKMADLRFRRSREWGDLPLATVMLTHALVSDVPEGAARTLSSLIITAQQRRAIIQRLEKDLRRVSTTLRHLHWEFTEYFALSVAC